MAKIKIQPFKLSEKVKELAGRVIFISLTPIQITDKERNLINAKQINFHNIQIEEMNGLTPEPGGSISFPPEGLPESYQKSHLVNNVLTIEGGNEILRYKFTKDREENAKTENQQKLLNWIRNSHLTHVSWDDLGSTFFNFNEEEKIEERKISDPDAIAEELANHIIANGRKFNLNRWMGVTPNIAQVVQASGGDFPWWDKCREISKEGSGFFHPAVFLTKERYRKVFEAIVGNLTISQYNQIDDNDESKEIIRDNMRTNIREENGWGRDHEIPSIYDHQIKEDSRQDGGCEFNPKKFLAQDEEPENSGHSIQLEDDLKQVFRNSNEFKKFIEVNNFLTLENFANWLPIEEWINADGIIDFAEIRNFFLEGGLNIPEEEPTSSNEGGTENNSGSEPQNDNNGEPESITTPSPNNTNSSLQTAKSNAIREIITALVNQEPRLTTKHDLSEGNQDWKKKIIAADNENDIINIRDKVLIDIAVKRKAKKATENIVNNLETEGKDADQLKNQLEEVEKSRGQQDYEDNQTGIDNLKNKLAEKVSDEEYCQIITGNIEKNMVKYDIKEDELDSEVKIDLKKLKNGEIKDKNQVNEIEEKIVKNAGEKGSLKKINKILAETQQAIKSGDKNKIKAVKNKLYSLLASTDIYEKSLIVSKRNDLNKALKDLENSSFQKPTISDQFPLKIVVSIALISIAAFILGVIVYRKRKKRLRH